MSLQAEGFRYVLWQAEDGDWFGKWTHPACMLPSDIDVTDLSDDAFAELLASLRGERAEQ